MNRRSRLSSASPAMGLTKRPASENGRSALRPGGSGALPKNRVPLTDISNASRRKNSEKPSSSSIGTKGGNLRESVTSSQTLVKKKASPSSSLKIHDTSLRRKSSVTPNPMVRKQNHVVCAKESGSSAMGLAKRPASVKKPSGLGGLPKKGVALQGINDASASKNNGKLSSSSFRDKGKNLSENITKPQPLKKNVITPSSLSKVHDKGLRRSSSGGPYSMVIKQNHIVCPKESDSSEMGLTRKSAVESGGSAVKLSGFGDLLKKRISLANVSGKKNSGKPSPSSIRSKNKNLAQREYITKDQSLKKKASPPSLSSSVSKARDRSLRCNSSVTPNPVVMKQNHAVAPRESSSSRIGISKRPVAENGGNAVKLSGFSDLLKKRMALTDIKNASGRKNSGKPLYYIGTKDKYLEKKPQKENITSGQSVKKKASPKFDDKSLRPSSKVVPNPLVMKQNYVVSPKESLLIPLNLSVNHSEGDSMSLDETSSTTSHVKSPDFEYIDNVDSSVLVSQERHVTVSVEIPEVPIIEGADYSYEKDRDFVVIETSDDVIVDIDWNHEDPQLCATLACDIYKHLRVDEMTKRPSADFMEAVQKDINASMRAILMDWLVEVAEEYRLVPETLYLTVNYVDRYLSCNEINRQCLQLLGVSCMLIASKYEEICAPQVEDFCYITDNTYLRDEVLRMEADVLKHLKFEMSVTTINCFLRRFIHAAQLSDRTSSLSQQFEFLACYAAELTLLEYNFLSYAPSIVAASSVFLAKFILNPTKRPWNATLDHYTLYKPSELSECVKAMHLLLLPNSTTGLPAIREKYNQPKYEFVGNQYCPPQIPQEFFHEQPTIK